jgi:hypothetical protein
MGVGQNEGSASDGELEGGDCLRLLFRNGDGGTPLPDCCDCAAAAKICVTHSVTEVDNHACSPAYFSGAFKKYKDGETPQGFSCKDFEPTNHDTTQSSQCSSGSDNNLDGWIDNCLCGDFVTNGSETCDATDLDGESCVSQGFSSGTLRCNADCRGFDTALCN